MQRKFKTEITLMKACWDPTVFFSPNMMNICCKSKEGQQGCEGLGEYALWGVTEGTGAA